MALATLTDVRRVLRITSDDVLRDAALQAALDAAEEWFRARSGWQYDEDGNGTAKFFAVPSGGSVRLPLAPATVLAVRIAAAGTPDALWDEQFRELGTDHWQLQGGRTLRLRDWRSVGITGGTYSTWDLEVDYTAPTLLSRTVRDGVARLAAADWMGTGGGGDVVTGVTEEKIGDYSYKIGTTSQADVIDAGQLRTDGLRILRPFLGRGVSVT
jgi:hypothetical protein